MSAFIPTKRGNPCPICDDTSSKCRTQRGSDLVLCMSFAGAHSAPNGWHFIGDTKDRLWGKFFPARESDQDSLEWQRRKAERDRHLEEVRQQELLNLSKALPLDERSNQNRKFLLGLDLEPHHRQNLLERGLTEKQIQEGLLRSISPRQKLKHPVSPRLAGVSRDGQTAWVTGEGFLCPAYNPQGQILGMQLRLDNSESGRYRWLKSSFSSKLPNGEMPLTVVKPDGEVKRIGLAEGILKPCISAKLSQNTIFIGASGGNFTASEQQLKAALKWAREEYGNLPIAFYPDAGGVSNLQVARRDRATLKLLEEWGYQVEIAWWEQGSDKEALDIDELLAVGRHKEIKFIKPSQYNRLVQKAEAMECYRQLNRLSYKPTTELNQRYMGKQPLPKPQTIAAITSACKTGKTETLVHQCQEHRSQYPEGKILLVGYRNALLHQTSERTSIPHIQDLAIGKYGLDVIHLNYSREVGLCLDSLLKLELDKVVPNTLVILDEGEAVLKHGVEGGTLGAEQAKILAHFQLFLNRVLELGGSIQILEDSLTDLSLNLLRDATGGKYPIELTQNHYQASHWDVQIGGGSPSGFVANILNDLSEGKRVFVPTTSQAFGEQLEWIVKRLFPHKKGDRVDSETVENQGDLMSKPNEVLAAKELDWFICSPTIESGFSCYVDAFDEVHAYLVNLDTRTHIQFLERLRLDVLRCIYASDFLPGDDGNGRGFNPARIKKDWKISAQHTARLSQIEPEKLGDLLDKPSPEGELWNHYAALFKARTNASQAALRDNLVASLKARGHEVEEKTWGNDKQVRGLLKEAKKAIEAKKAKELHEADFGQMKPEEAKRILKSQSAKRKNRLKAKKCLLADKLPGAKLTEDFILKAVVERRGRFLRSTELLWMLENREVASLLDKKALEKAAEGPFIMLRRLNHNRLKADLLYAHRRLLELTDGREYREGDEILQEVKQIAEDRRGEIWRVLGLTVKSEHSGIKIANKLLRRLGYDAIVSRKEGCRGNQERIWKVDLSTSHTQHRHTILAALTRKLSPLLESAKTSTQQVVGGLPNPVVSTSKLDSGQYKEVATTMAKALQGGDSSPNQAEWSGVALMLEEFSAEGILDREAMLALTSDLSAEEKQQIWESLAQLTRSRLRNLA